MQNDVSTENKKLTTLRGTRNLRKGVQGWLGKVTTQGGRNDVSSNWEKRVGKGVSRYHKKKINGSWVRRPERLVVVGGEFLPITQRT